MGRIKANAFDSNNLHTPRRSAIASQRTDTQLLHSGMLVSYEVNAVQNMHNVLHYKPNRKQGFIIDAAPDKGMPLNKITKVQDDKAHRIL